MGWHGSRGLAAYKCVLDILRETERRHATFHVSAIIHPTTLGCSEETGQKPRSTCDGVIDRSVLHAQTKGQVT